MKISFGQTATLKDGMSCTVLDADENAGIFVKVASPVALQCGGTGKHAGDPLGTGDKFWAPLENWQIARDQDGVKTGIEQPEPQKPVMTNREIWEAASATWVPSEDDLKCPDNIRFYRAWHATKALLAHLGHTDPFTAPINVHTICCWTIDGTWAQFAAAVKHVTPTKYPEEPRTSCFWRSEPTKPTEERAREFFKREYKHKWPEKRLGTKHARESWEKVKDQAMHVVQTTYEEELAAYRKAESEHETRQEAIKAKWFAECVAIDNTKLLAQALIG